MSRTSIALVLAGVLALPAWAGSGPSYDYVEAGYTYLDPDDFSSVDGFGAGGSIAINPDIHLTADYDRVTGSGVKAHLARVAVGFNSYIDHRSDFIARAGYFRSKADSTDHGFLVETGVRAILFGWLELNTFVTYVDDSVFGDDLSLAIGSVFNFTGNLGFSIRAEASNERNQAHARLRYVF